VASRLNKNVQHTRTRYEKQFANFIVIKLKEANVYEWTMAPALTKITGDTNADAPSVCGS